MLIRPLFQGTPSEAGRAISYAPMGHVTRQLGQAVQAPEKYAETSLKYRAGVAVLERMIARGQNRESAGKENGILEALIAECEEKIEEGKTGP